MKPHRHAEVIKQWADGATIEYRNDLWQKEWTVISDDRSSILWDDNVEYRVKPEKVYPETRMTMQELGELWNQTPFGVGIAGITCHIANAAIRHAIDEGQVVPLSEITAYTDKRDMAIANAMKAEAIRISNIYSTGLGRYLLDYIDVNATVAGVE